MEGEDLRMWYVEVDTFPGGADAIKHGMRGIYSRPPEWPIQFCDIKMSQVLLKPLADRIGPSRACGTSTCGSATNSAGDAGAEEDDGIGVTLDTRPPTRLPRPAFVSCRVSETGANRDHNNSASLMQTVRFLEGHCASACPSI